MPQITRLLVANRGEIARRVFATCRRMGIGSVAVYSDADRLAPHVADADIARRIGPPPARESYLDGARIIAAALEAGADAIHPGYGFLSENAGFAEAVMAAGITWVGPPPSAIRAMGLKDAAKALMASAHVPVTPGYLGEDQDEDRLAEEAAKIGYPVLIKAVAGGGGKGMRRVDSAEGFAAALAAARREARAAFGDDRVLLETYVRRPRHIEVQVFGDAHGQVVHLFERDCSLQRRHQKVIEEAPAPGMDEATRAMVTGAAVRAAQAVGYQGAGTIEFIADASEGLSPDRIWFMEMNTRLQVEHPVTEAVTGQDLVEWQLRVAAGEPLPLTQDQIRLSGHAVEARLYAESPASGFLPSIGTLDYFHIPSTVRVDAGVEQGCRITSFYDPMIAKLIAHGPTRDRAIETLARACDAVRVWPVQTNAAFLGRCLREPDFIAGDVDTGFIERRMQSLVTTAQPSAAVLAAAGKAAAKAVRDADPDGSPWTAIQGFRLNAPAESAVQLFFGGKPVSAELAGDGAEGPSSLIDADGQVVVFEAGEAFAFRRDPDLSGLEGAGSSDSLIRAPMPGTVTHLSAAVGQAVIKGQTLLVLEAMKMEYSLNAPCDSRVAEVHVSLGSQVNEGDVLVTLEAD